jgi:hypothetical protein
MERSMMNREPRLLATGLALCVAFSSIGAATPPAPAAHDIASAIRDVAPDQGEIVIPFDKGEHLEVKTAQGEIEIPRDPAEFITTTASADETLPNFGVSLPTELSLADPQVAPDGTVVFSSTHGGPDAAVQVLDDGSTRIQTVIPEAGFSSEYTYAFPDGFSPLTLPGGKVAIVGPAGPTGGYALFDDAWAVDGAGHPVETVYEIRGAEVVQVVRPAQDAVYPIVADPKWTWHLAAYGAKFNKAETRSFANAGGVTGACAALAKRAPQLAVACGAYGAYFFSQASIANGNRECIFFSVAPAPLVWRYRDGDCR